MKSCTSFCLVLIALVFFVAAGTASGQEFPSGLLQALPHAAEKLSSEDLQQRVSILQELVVSAPMSCTMELNLPFDLKKEDYAFVVGKLLEKDMRQLDEKTGGNAWYLLTHLIAKFQMKEFAGPIAEYLTEGYLGDSRSGLQYRVIDTLHALQAKEFDSKIAPYATSARALGLQHIALQTLISFKSHKAVPALLEKLSDEHNRWWAIDKLAEIGAVQTAPQIAEMLKVEDENIPHWAIDALTRLNAKGQSKALWQFLKYSKNERQKGFAVAALIQFEQKEAVIIAVDQAKGNAQGSENYFVWEYIDKLKPKFLIPTMMSLYYTKTPFFANAEHEKKFRFSVLQVLISYRTPLAIPIYRENLVDRSDGNKPNSWMAGILQQMNATEALDDIITIFNDLAKSPAGTDANYRAGEFAVVLARFGARKTWKSLIDFVEKSDYYERELIISEMNRFLDPKLWEESHAKIPKGPYVGPIKVIAEKAGSDTGIPIVLDYEPKTAPVLCRTDDSDETDGFPCAWADGRDSLYNVALIIGSKLNDRPRGQYTFVFDRGTIRIMKIDKAIEWWRKNILNKTN